MIYKLKEHVTNEMLVAVGFYKYVKFDSTDMLRDVNDDIQVYIPLESYGLKKRYVMNNYGDDKLVIPYIQDLIELDYVEELK